MAVRHDWSLHLRPCDLFCPLPERAVIFAGYSTTVCPLCFGALLGLTDVLLSFPFRPRVRRRWECLPWQLQLTLMTSAIVPWLGDYIANKAEWSLTPQWTMHLLGIPGGLAVGLPTYFVLGKEEETASACLFQN